MKYKKTFFFSTLVFCIFQRPNHSLYIYDPYPGTSRYNQIQNPRRIYPVRQNQQNLLAPEETIIKNV